MNYNFTVAGRIKCQIYFQVPVRVRFSGDAAYGPTGSIIYIYSIIVLLYVLSVKTDAPVAVDPKC